MLLNYHIGCIVPGLLCVGVRVRLGWGGIRAAGSKQRHFEGAAQENRKQPIKNYHRVTISILLSLQSLCVAYEGILKEEINLLASELFF
jgi:hypothetical protein